MMRTRKWLLKAAAEVTPGSVIVKLTEVAPVGMGTVAGTVATDVFVLPNVSVAPEGAVPLNIAVPNDVCCSGCSAGDVVRMEHQGGDAGGHCC